MIKLHWPALALGAFGLVGFGAIQAEAAITVIGKGLARQCYEMSEAATSPVQGIDICTQALNEEPMPIGDRASTYVNRGTLRVLLRDYSGALRDFDKGMSIDPTLGEAYVDHGAAMIGLKRYDEALDYVNKGIELGAHRPHIAYYNRAIAHEELGRIREAYEDYKKALELAPNFYAASEQLQRFKVVSTKANGT